MNRPIQATIVTHNLEHNLVQVKNITQNKKIWAVVKANAYGHGIEAVVSAFAQADGLALLDLNHAQKLRELAWNKRILLLEGIFSREDLIEVQKLKCDIVIHDIRQLEWLENYIENQLDNDSSEIVEQVHIWLKMNSGMNRLGFKSSEYGVVYHHLTEMGFTVNHMTHFANADELKLFPNVAYQWEIFLHTIQFLDGERSAANSAAILQHSKVHADWVRPGIMLYGASPSGIYKDIQDKNLKPTMLLTSKIIAIQEIGMGETVGYGSQFKAEKNTRVGVIACGYADGYPRSAPQGTPVWVFINDFHHGKIVKIIGRVSMDMMTVDITDLPEVEVGTKVELWGEQIPIDEVAAACGTVGYELMCALAPRVPVVIV